MADTSLAIEITLLAMVLLALPVLIRSLLAHRATAGQLRLLLQEQQEMQRREQSAQSEVLSFVNALTEHSIFSETDPSGTILEVNDAFCRISGYSRDQLIGQNHRIVNSRTHPAEFWGEMWRTLRSGKPWRQEVCNRARDGQLYWVDSMIVPLLDEQGKILRVLSIRHDITARKQYERELVAAREAAEAASSSKDAFLASMSHELRTPLNSIIGYASLLQEEKGLTPKQSEASSEIEQAGRHLLDLINDILDLSAISSGEFHVELAPTSVDSVLHECFSLIKQIASKNGIALTLHTSGGLKVMSNPVRLKQVLLNLLSNAIKYNRSQGQVRLELQTLPDSTLRFKVIDNGRGIAAEKIQDLFRPFNRLGEDASQIEGTGIGLSITKQLVESMHGRIGVQSALGVGSAFWFDLSGCDERDLRYPAPGALTTDAIRQAVGQPALEESGSALHAGAQRILVVEDNPVNRKLIGRQLESLGFGYDCAKHGLEALEKLESSRYDLILSDLQMPLMDGYELASAVRALPDHPCSDVTMIALSANVFEKDKKKWREAGFNDYLTKPISVLELRERLALHLGPPALQPSPDAPAQPAADYAGAAVFDPAVLPEMVGHDPAAVRELTADFLHQGAVCCDEIEPATRARDWPQVAGIAHQLASMALSIGAMRLGGLCRAIENACEAPDEAVLAPMLAELRPFWLALQQAMDAAACGAAAGGAEALPAPGAVCAGATAVPPPWPC